MAKFDVFFSKIDLVGYPNEMTWHRHVSDKASAHAALVKISWYVQPRPAKNWFSDHCAY